MLRVLLVDGSPSVRLALARALLDGGCAEVRCAANVPQAVRILQLQSFHALFTALRPRATSGFELLNYAETYRPRMTRILHTGDTYSYEAGLALELADHVVPRPASTQQVHRIVAQLFQEAHRVA